MAISARRTFQSGAAAPQSKTSRTIGAVGSWADLLPRRNYELPYLPNRSMFVPMHAALAMIALALILAPSVSAQGVRYLTRVTVKSPGIGMVDPMLLPRNAPSATNASVSTVAPRPPARVYSRPRVSNPTPPPDLDRKLLEFHKRRAEQGAAHAQLSLAIRYLKGNGVPKDAALARKWLTASAANGNAEAAKLLRRMKRGD